MKQTFRCQNCTRTVTLEINGNETAAELRSKFYWNGGGWLYQEFEQFNLCSEHRLIKRIDEAEEELELAKKEVDRIQSVLDYRTGLLVKFYKSDK